jgi:hypothetical protein
VAAVPAGIGCLVLLAAPTVWSVVSVQNNNGAAWLPQAGPPGGFGFRGGPGGGPQFQQGGFRGGFGGGPRGGRPGVGPAPNGGPGGFPGFAGRPGGPGGGPGGGGRGGGAGAMTFAGDQWDSLDPGLVDYLLANQGSATFLVATPTSSYASLFILATDQPAMALGGYQGWDRILTPERLAALVHDGVVRYFWMNGASGPGNGGLGNGRSFGQSFGPGQAAGASDGQTIVSSSQDATGDLLAWVRSSCAVVSPEAWQASDDGGPGRGDARGGLQLYDCGALGPQG